MSADLHCHTVMSDGAVSIEEIVLLAKNKGLTTIAVTDHDTFAGVTRAKTFGKKHGVNVVEGAEISAYDYKRKRKVHILAYMCEYPNRLMGMLKKTNDSRKKAMLIAINKVSHLYPIPADMILRRAQGSANIYKQHVMKALVDSGITNEIYGDVYKKLFHPKTGFAKTVIEYPDVFEVVDAIHEAGGVAVLAHPAVYDSMDLLVELAQYGIDGVERYYPRAIEEDDAKLEQIINDYNLITTGGTDFHGSNAGEICPIGTSVVDDHVVELIKERRRKYIYECLQ